MGVIMNTKKILCVFLIPVFFCITIFAYSVEKSYKQQEESSVIPWIWLGAKALAAGATTYFAIKGLNDKSEYEKQLSLIDNTTIENYNKLLDMKKSTEAELNLALGLGIGTGLSTLANILFWNMFNKKEDKKFSLEYDPVRRAYILAANRGF